MRDQLTKGEGEGGKMLRMLADLETPEGQPDLTDQSIGPIYQDSIAWSETTFGLL